MVSARWGPKSMNEISRFDDLMKHKKKGTEIYSVPMLIFSLPAEPLAELFNNMQSDKGRSRRLVLSETKPNIENIPYFVGVRQAHRQPTGCDDISCEFDFV